MVQYVNLDMTLGEIASAVLNEYKEPVTGSSAMPLDTVYDKINEVYLDIFNEPADDSYLRESDFTFTCASDTTLNGAVSAGASSITLTDASEFPNTARTILIGGKDFATYTGSNLTTTLSGVSGVDVNHIDGSVVQLGYSLSAITDIDEQLINAVIVNGVPYAYQQPSVWLNTGNNNQYFTIFEGVLFLPKGVSSQIITIIYSKKLTMMTTSGSKPTLIPGKYRPGLLVSGAIYKMGVRDEMRTGWEYHNQRYALELKKFYAFANNRIKTKGPIVRPSIYD
jgi:hypothetical protein